MSEVPFERGCEGYGKCDMLGRGNSSRKGITGMRWVWETEACPGGVWCSCDAAWGGRCTEEEVSREQLWKAQKDS